MYSLPIVSYGDFWRMAKDRSITWGGTLVLAGSTLVYAPVDNLPTGIDLKLPSLEGLSLTARPPVNQTGAAFTAMPDTTMSDSTMPGTVSVDIPGTLAQPAGISAVEEGGVGTAVLGEQITYAYRIEDVEIPITTEYVESPKVLPGTTQIQEEGAIGIQRQVIRTTTVAGEVGEEEIIHQFTLNSPKKRVVMQNTQPVERVEADLSQYTVVNTFGVEATAYTYTGNPTASGVYPREGLIAVDPRVIPLGTEVYVEGYGYAIAADTGGAIKGNIIDVFFPSFQTCIEWGRRPVTIHILAKKTEG